MLFIEETSPPPFYQEQLSDEQRTQLDKWFIGKRSQSYYLKRFKEFDEQGYLSAKWHWAAFFATFGWLLYRKRYMDCIVYTVAGWSFIQLNVAIILSLFEFLFVSSFPDAYQMIFRLSVAGIIWLFWSFMVARWSDAYYYRMARREIADALQDYPRDPEKQKQHLQREGGVSVVGLAIAFGMFLFTLLVIQQQFLPLYAKPKENGIIQDTFIETRIATTQLEKFYSSQGYCPVNIEFDNDVNNLTNLTFDVTQSTPSLGNLQTSCVLIATIQNVPFPNRNLNNQTYIMYRTSTDKTEEWKCITTLNDKQKPSICRED